MPEEIPTGIRGTITNGPDLSDEILIANSLSITRSTCSKDNFTIGTFNAAVLKLTIKANFAYDFAGAQIDLTCDGNSLGRFWVDESQIKRDGKTVTLTAYDAAALFDVEMTETDKAQQYTASTALAAAITACQASSVTLGSIPAELPNQAISFTPSSESIQTWRDLIMWVAQLLGANAMITGNKLLVLRPASSTTADDFTSAMSERQSIQFSDTRTWVEYLSTYSAGNPRSYKLNREVNEANERPGSLSLPRNPLLDDKSQADCDTINLALIMGIRALQRGIVARCVGSPLIEPGMRGTFSGTRFSQNFNVTGTVSSVTWRYRGITTVMCTAPLSVKEAGNNAG